MVNSPIVGVQLYVILQVLWLAWFIYKKSLFFMIVVITFFWDYNREWNLNNSFRTVLRINLIGRRVCIGSKLLHGSRDLCPFAQKSWPVEYRPRQNLWSQYMMCVVWCSLTNALSCRLSLHFGSVPLPSSSSSYLNLWSKLLFPIWRKQVLSSWASCNCWHLKIVTL